MACKEAQTLGHVGFGSVHVSSLSVFEGAVRLMRNRLRMPYPLELSGNQKASQLC